MGIVKNGYWFTFIYLTLVSSLGDVIAWIRPWLSLMIILQFEIQVSHMTPDRFSCLASYASLAVKLKLKLFIHTQGVNKDVQRNIYSMASITTLFIV